MNRRFSILIGCALAGVLGTDGAEAKRYYRYRVHKIEKQQVANLAAKPAADATAAAAEPVPPSTQAGVADAAPTAANPPLPTFLAMLFQPQTAPALAVPATAEPATPEPATPDAAVASGSTNITRSTPMRELVAKHAAANGVPFALAHAVIMIESKYSARVAHAGNYGLMQIRAQTARGMGFNGSAAGLLDAETNLRFGMKYLALAYKMAHGDTCGTVMRYQSGTGTTRMSAANRAYCAKARAYMAGL